MKKIFVVLLVCLALLVGCASAKYNILLRDGRQFKATSKPELDKKSGYYTYVDEDGKKVLLKEADVLKITED